MEQAREAAHLLPDGSYRHHGLFYMRPMLRTSLRALGLWDRGIENANRLSLNERTLRVDHLPPSLDGFRILHLSDFHFDDRPHFADAVVRLVEGTECDLCVITGDFRFDIVGPADAAFADTERVLQAVDSRLGFYGVLGNHDFAEFADAFEPMGLRILMNERVEVDAGAEALTIAGVDDPHYYRTDSVDHAAAGMNGGAFPIMLAHSPEVIPQAASAGFKLYLCGHTHWGQIRLPFFGAPMRGARCHRMFCRGAWQYEGMAGYTTAGLGTTDVPVRYNCPPEAVLIELRRTGR